MRIAIIQTHPIQYYSPLYKTLTERNNINIKVFYTWPQAIGEFKDPDFNTNVKWDIPLLEGYNYQLIENTSQKPSSKNYMGIDNPNLINEVKEFNPNVILVFGWKFKSHFKLMRYFKGKVPVWFRGDSTLLDEAKNIKVFIRKIILSFVYNYIDKAFYVGENNKAYFIKHGIKSSNLIFAPHAVDNNRFTDSPSDNYEQQALQWRTLLGIKKEDIVCLFCGKFNKKKNPLLLLNQILEFNKTLEIKIKLILVGNGVLEQDLKSLANNNENIFFLPFQNQSKMPIVYRLGTFTCLPSQGPEETWGLVVNESLASGRPVIVSDKVGCAIDLVTRATGRIFKNNNPTDLHIKLKELYYEHISSETCQQFISDWSYTRLCQSIENEANRLK